jgi:hypothetical protein
MEEVHFSLYFSLITADRDAETGAHATACTTTYNHLISLHNITLYADEIVPYFRRLRAIKRVGAVSAVKRPG